MTEAIENHPDEHSNPMNAPAIHEAEETQLGEENTTSDLSSSQSKKRPLRRSYAVWALIMMVIYGLGLGSGYGIWGLPTPEERAHHNAQAVMTKILQQVNPPEGYRIPARYGDLGPQMAAAGVFSVAEFEQVYQQANKPLNDEQMTILKKGSDAPIVFNNQNAYFLLNYFWAVGLSNKNPILDSGPIQQNSQGNVGGFASTGGWTLATKPLLAIYSTLPLITLTDQQQKSLEEAAIAIYRPCCDNPTQFPDCNHGMAMLGLMELMASQNATLDQMLEAAKYANAYWYPAQTIEQGIFFKTTTGNDYAKVDAKLLLGSKYSSGSGFQAVHQYLSQNSLLPEAPRNGGGCGV